MTTATTIQFQLKHDPKFQKLLQGVQFNQTCDHVGELNQIPLDIHQYIANTPIQLYNDKRKINIIMLY